MRQFRITRRAVLQSGAGLALPAIARGQTLKPAKIAVGRQPWAAGNSPITQYMINNKLYEKHAAAQGYALTVDWRDYPSALPMVEALVGNNLDMGMWGNTPIIRVIQAQQKISTLIVGEGHFRFVLCVRKDSPIRNAADLKGKTVGALLGGDPYNALSQILKYELGTGDPKALGINIVNTPTAAQAAAVPTGMDAAITTYPAFLAAVPTGTVGVLNSFGYTEAHYKGPEGEGAGLLLPSVKKSAFYPDGYYLHRSFWVLRDAVAEKDPAIVTAFVTAHQEALAALCKMDPGAVSQLVSSYWKLSPEDGAKVVKDEVLFQRGWAWPTEGDARAILETSKYMVEGRLIDKPLTWAQVKASFARTAPLMKAAYDKSGGVPPAADFMSSQAQDLRGLPAWEMDKWTDRT